MREEFVGCTRLSTLEEGLDGVDVVMMLRIQKERFAADQRSRTATNTSRATA